MVCHFSEFEELEAVPSLSVMEGPLEPSSTAFTATDAPEDPSFINFFSVRALICYQRSVGRLNLLIFNYFIDAHLNVRL